MTMAQIAVELRTLRDHLAVKDSPLEVVDLAANNPPAQEEENKGNKANDSGA